MTRYIAESERLGLQPLSLEAHIEGYHAAQSNEKAVKFIHREPVKSIKESKALMISRHLPNAENPHRELFAILLRGTEDEEGKPTMVGTLGIPRVSKDGKAVEVGYGVNPDYWGNGYAPEALKCFIHYYWNIREGPSRDKIIAYTDPENIASRRVLEKSGFARGELIEKAYPAPDVVTKEMIWYPAYLWSLERPQS